MSSSTSSSLPDAATVAGWSVDEVVSALSGLHQQVDALKAQLEWFKRQLFGRKSERFIPEVNPQQLHLGQSLPVVESETPAGKDVAAHRRKAPRSDFAKDEGAAPPFFDESKVPVETIAVANPEIEGLAADQYEVIGEKTTFRLAQRPGSYVVLK